MIIEEYIEDGQRVKHYSNENFKLMQIETGIIYDDAVDIVPCPYTYEEIDEPIEEDEISDSEALGIIIGEMRNEEE